MIRRRRQVSDRRLIPSRKTHGHGIKMPRKTVLKFEWDQGNGRALTPHSPSCIVSCF